MAKRKVHRRAEKVLDREPSALVWCSIPRAVPKPPKDVHRAAGKGQLKGRHHWLVCVGAVVFCAVIIPMHPIDMLGKQIDRRFEGRSRRDNPRRAAVALGAGVRAARPRPACAGGRETSATDRGPGTVSSTGTGI
jgi:hypothetical protein